MRTITSIVEDVSCSRCDEVHCAENSCHDPGDCESNYNRCENDNCARLVTQERKRKCSPRWHSGRRRWAGWFSLNCWEETHPKCRKHCQMCKEDCDQEKSRCERKGILFRTCNRIANEQCIWESDQREAIYVGRLKDGTNKLKEGLQGAMEALDKPVAVVVSAVLIPQMVVGGFAGYVAYVIPRSVRICSQAVKALISMKQSQAFERFIEVGIEFAEFGWEYGTDAVMEFGEATLQWLKEREMPGVPKFLNGAWETVQTVPGLFWSGVGKYTSSAINGDGLLQADIKAAMAWIGEKLVYSVVYGYMAGLKVNDVVTTVIDWWEMSPIPEWLDAMWGCKDDWGSEVEQFRADQKAYVDSYLDQGPSEAPLWDFTDGEVKLAAKLANNAYWVGTRPEHTITTTAFGGWKDPTQPACWGTQGPLGYPGEPDFYQSSDLREDCTGTRAHDEFDYQGRIHRCRARDHPMADGSLQECITVDIYHSRDNAVCYVSFRGSDELGDWYSNFNLDYMPDGYGLQGLSHEDLAKFWRPVGGGAFYAWAGFVDLYQGIRDEIMKACSAPVEENGESIHRSMWATGHSMGGALAMIMNANGDAVQSIGFAAPASFLVLPSIKQCDLAATDGLPYHRRDNEGVLVGLRGRSLSVFFRDVKNGGVDPVEVISPLGGSHCSYEHIELSLQDDGSFANFANQKAVMRNSRGPSLSLGCGCKTFLSVMYGAWNGEFDKHLPGLSKMNLHAMRWTYVPALYSASYGSTSD